MKNGSIRILRQNTGETQRTQGLGSACTWSAQERDIRVRREGTCQRVPQALASSSEKPIHLAIRSPFKLLGFVSAQECTPSEDRACQLTQLIKTPNMPSSFRSRQQPDARNIGVRL